MPVAGAGSVGEVVIAVTVGSCACSVLTLLGGPPCAARLEAGGPRLGSPLFGPLNQQLHHRATRTGPMDPRPREAVM